MAHKTHLALLSASAAADAVIALMNGGKLRIYTNPAPADPQEAITTQVLLAELTFGTPAFAAAVGGIATANAIGPETNAPATGTAHWFRIVRSDGNTAVLDGEVGAVGSATLVLSSTSITSGARVEVTSLTYEHPRE